MRYDNGDIMAAIHIDDVPIGLERQGDSDSHIFDSQENRISSI